jgi:hypothetical protein
MATYIVERAKLGGGLVQAGVGREDGAATFTLIPDNPTHGDGVVVEGAMSTRELWLRFGCASSEWAKIRLVTLFSVSAPRHHLDSHLAIEPHEPQRHSSL